MIGINNVRMCKLIDYICTAKLKYNDVPNQIEHLKVIKYALDMVAYNNGSDTHKNIINQLNSFKNDIQSYPDQFSASKFLDYLSNTSYNNCNTLTKPKKIFISENELLAIKGICNLYPQFQLFGFGSRVKGTHSETSDLDIVYKIIKPIEFLPRNAIPYYNEFCNMEDEIKSKITSTPISIVSWNDLSDTFKKLIEDDLVSIL